MKNKPDLVINRGMGNSITEFKEWAEKEYHNDYGTAFLIMWQLIAPNNAVMEERISALEDEVALLKGQPKKERKGETREPYRI